MHGEIKGVVARAQLALVTALGAALVLVLPSLSITASDAANAITLGVLMLAVAALVRFGSGSVPLAAGPGAALAPTSDQAPPVLPGRVTDPVHHPLRPRAPGLA